MSTSALKRICSAFFVLSLVVAAGCGSDSSTTTTNTNPASVLGTTYSGVLEDGSVVNLTFPQAAALVADRAATSSTVNVTGDVTTATGTKYTVSGTYDPSTGAFSVSGGGWTLTGTYTNGTIQGTYTGPNSTSGGFVAGNKTAVTTYCGSYSGSESGHFMIVASGAKAFLAVKGRVLEGTISSTKVTFTLASPAISVSADVSGTSLVNGIWSVTDTSTKSGTWSGSSAACPTSSGTVNTQCNAVSGTWTVGATTNQVAQANTACSTILPAIGTISPAATVTVTTSGSSVSVKTPDGSTLQGTFDPATCKATLTDSINDSVTVGTSTVTVVGSQTNDITFNSNNSLTNAWTIRITSATGVSGTVPCTVTATQSGTK